MPAANPDPMRRLGVEKPVVTIQTMNNKLNPAVPVRRQAVTPGPREHAHRPSCVPAHRSSSAMNSITTRTRTQYKQASGSNATAGWNVVRMLLWGVCWAIALEQHITAIPQSSSTRVLHSSVTRAWRYTQR
eukprot:scaffold24106_cov75-Phaeocystis_antarctica.AAC.3